MDIKTTTKIRIQFFTFISVFKIALPQKIISLEGTVKNLWSVTKIL